MAKLNWGFATIKQKAARDSEHWHDEQRLPRWLEQKVAKQDEAKRKQADQKCQQVAKSQQKKRNKISNKQSKQDSNAAWLAQNNKLK